MLNEFMSQVGLLELLITYFASYCICYILLLYLITRTLSIMQSEETIICTILITIIIAILLLPPGEIRDFLICIIEFFAGAIAFVLILCWPVTLKWFVLTFSAILLYTYTMVKVLCITHTIFYKHQLSVNIWIQSRFGLVKQC